MVGTHSGREAGVRVGSADEEIARVSRYVGFPRLRTIGELTPWSTE